ncbi:IclR family transcriptional regulator [Streptomyces iranensis]|uniref:Glycerol operon regulatory protein n=1 Tax=Streptomyces iranensis TaxID=576784 RepID=A0A061A019_9ACTN|nr:IclR family transcriptional regulator [Streptomyces iranensis]CDR13898.1 transcriptional regulator, IclR family [Streptomyces iranensis]
MIQSVQRAFQLLEAIAAAPRGARLSDIADAAHLNRSTTHNLLATLQELGYVAQPTRGGVYTLTDRLTDLARGASVADDLLRERLHPALEKITQDTGETCYLAVPAGAQYLCLDAVEAPAPLRLTIPIGGREPLLSTAIGHALLSGRPDLRNRLADDDPAAWKRAADGLEQARADGYALDLAGYHPDISCAAVPLWEDDRARAAIAVAGPTTRLPEARLRRIATHIRETVTGQPSP